MNVQLLAAPFAVLCNYIEFTYMPLVLYFFSQNFGNKNRRFHLNYLKSHSSSFYSSLLEFFVDNPGFAQKFFALFDFALRAMQMYGVYQVVKVGAATLGETSLVAMLILIAIPLITKIAQLFWKELTHLDSVITTGVFTLSLIYGFEGVLLSELGHFDIICILSFLIPPLHHAIITTSATGPGDYWNEVIDLEKKRSEIDVGKKTWDDDTLHAKIEDFIALKEVPGCQDERYRKKIRNIKRQTIMYLHEILIPREIRFISNHLTQVCTLIEQVDPVKMGSIQDIFSHLEDLEGIELVRLERDLARYYTIKRNIPEGTLQLKQLLSSIKPGILDGLGKKLKTLQELYLTHFVGRIYPEYLSKMQNLASGDIKTLSNMDMMLLAASMRESLRTCVQVLDLLALSNSSREILTMLDVPVLFNISRQALQQRELLFGAPCGYLNETELKTLMKFYHENRIYFEI